MSTKSDLLPDVNHLHRQLAKKDREIQALMAKIDALSRHDPLTGALNRRSLMQDLEVELQRGHRTGHPFCLAIIDIDQFSQINDGYGHATGERVLKTVSDSAIRLLRVVDRFGYLGREQFGIVLPSTWMEQAVIAMGRLTEAVAATPWDSIVPGLVVTFSTGLTTNAPADTAGTMIQRVEKALAQAKQEGPNRLVQIEEGLPDMGQMDQD